MVQGYPADGRRAVSPNSYHALRSRRKKSPSDDRDVNLSSYFINVTDALVTLDRMIAVALSSSLESAFPWSKRVKSALYACEWTKITNTRQKFVTMKW